MSHYKIKIGKITLDGYYNYGNVLQSYALQQVLRKFGEVTALWHTAENFMPYIWYKCTLKNLVKFLLNWRDYRRNIFSDYHGMEIIRQGKIKDWCDRYINIRKASGRLHEIEPEYDYFVVGSDQVWNPHFSNLDDCFLTFTTREKRIAYAASISTPVIPSKRQDLYRSKLSEMAYISMREQQGADIVKGLINKEVPVMVDPTLLITPEEWRNVSRPPAWFHGEEYILTYFLGKRPEVVARLGSETGLKVINLLDKDVYEYYVMGPDEFIWAIEHAKLVYTDSFHGTVFSILFRTPFVVCDRVGGKVTGKMGSRIDTLLEYFDLESRRGTKDNFYSIDNPLTEPDWSKVDNVLDREKKRAYEYLKNAFGM